MDQRITIVKNYRNKETLRLMELQQLADTITKRWSSFDASSRC